MNELCVFGEAKKEARSLKKWRNRIMKMGFWLGSIVGAAAAVYYTRNKEQLMTAGFGNQIKNSLNNVMGSETQRQNNPNTTQTQSQDMDLGQVEQYVHEDPELKHQVDEIMREN